MLKKYIIANNKITFDVDFYLSDSEEMDKFKADYEKADITYVVRCDDENAMKAESETQQVIAINDNKKVYTYLSGIMEHRFYTQEAELMSRLVDSKGLKNVYVCKSFCDNCTNISDIVRNVNIEGAFLENDTMILHSNYIIYNGSSILFTGVSGSGKSTQGDLWEKYQGAEIINGDKSAIRFENNILKSYGVPFSGTSHICKNKDSRVRTIVAVVKDEKNFVEAISKREALKILLGQIAINRWNVNDMNKAIDLILKVVDAVPVVKLHCRVDEEATIVLKEFLDNNTKE